MEFVLLDVFQVQAAGHIVDVGPAKQRILVAALAAEVGRPVPVESLIDRIWDDDGPGDARRVLHTYVARVRRVLKQAHPGDLTQVTLERRPGGYQLVCDPDRVDLHRFRHLVGRARGLDRSDPQRAALLGEALALWRAEPLAGLPGRWAARIREGLRQQRLEAVNDWADAELTLGRPTNMVQHLPELMAQYPLAESLVARLMRALSMAGRDAEALEVYAQARQRIADELGSEPGTELRTTHETLLRQGFPSATREAVAPPAAPRSTTDSEQTGPAPVTAYQEQIGPILPASKTCLVIVTSRRSLALQGARTLRLETFTTEDAITLLANAVGSDRIAAEPHAAREIVTRCGGLPLAVTLAAQKLRLRPTWSITHLAARLAEGIVDFAVGRQGVESVFQLSYDALDPARCRLFRLLGVHPGPDITATAAAALAGIDPTDAEHALESLLDEHLLEQTVSGRYHLHELLHTYAGGRCASHDTPDERAAAITRLLGWYVEATDAAATVIRPFAVPVPWQGSPSPTPSPRFADEQEAFAWLDAEYPSLVAMIRLADEGQWYPHAIQFTHILKPYFIKRGLNKDRVMLRQRAEMAARRLGNTSALAHTLTDLGAATILVGDTAGATRYLLQALDLHRLLADRHGEATTLSNLGTVCARLDRHAEALGHHSASLDCLRDLDDVIGQRLGERGLPGILLNLAWICGRLERHTDAIEYTRKALDLYPPGLGGYGEIVALINLCFSYARVDRHAEAVTIGRQALALARQLAYPAVEATALNTLAEAHRLLGDHLAARQRHNDALTLATQFGFVDEQARARQGIALLPDVLHA